MNIRYSIQFALHFHCQNYSNLLEVQMLRNSNSSKLAAKRCGIFEQQRLALGMRVNSSCFHRIGCQHADHQGLPPRYRGASCQDTGENWL